MSRDIHIVEADSTNLTGEIAGDLSGMLVSVVRDGASIGFLSPLEKGEAESYWRQVPQEGVVLWIAQCDGKIAGSVQLHLALKPNALHRAEIGKLMVDPGFRRRGIAKQLMKVAEAKAKELGRSLLILDTREGDPSNLLYRQLGYNEAGSIPRFAKSSDGKLDGTVIYYKEL